MTSSADNSAARKGLISFDHNWQRLSRDDIYRQRVFGTESGASEFIPLHDKRKLSLLSMVVYLIFVYLTVMFVWPRVPVNVKFEVNNAIRASLERTSYETNPTPRYWDDIQSLQDLRSWLLYGFPTFVTPEVQGFNFPIGAIRFTLRRIKQEPNQDTRFNSLAPTTWVYKGGIELDDKSQTRDDTAPFGAYRDLSVIDEQGSSWEQRPGMKCDGGELLDVLEEVRADKTTVVRMCKNWCEELVADSKPCRCWQLNGLYKCEFFYMPLSALQNYSTSVLRLSGQTPSSAELAPMTREGNMDGLIFWPRMLKFTYSSSHDGWYETPGFVLYLNVYPQMAIIAAAALSGEVPMTQSQAVFRRIRDWIEGGLLSRGGVGLAIDFVTFNPNHEAFTWIQLTFQLEASGRITKALKLESLRITHADRRERDFSMQNDLSLSDIIYIVLVVLYAVWELWELSQRGLKYFYSGWNLLTLVCLLLHINTLISRYLYLSNAEFTRNLIEVGQNAHLASELQNPRLATRKFETQALAFSDFSLWSSMNLLFVWLQLVHYLNDIVPRIGVLVDAMYRSMTPIVFLVIIVADLFAGFVIWANLMFGKSVGAFKDLKSAIYSCTELLFGEVNPYYDLAPGYPVSGILFFFLYMFTFAFLLQSLSKAIVLVSYDDASQSHEQTKEQEENRKRAAESDSSDYLAKRWKQMQLSIKRFFTKADRHSAYDKDRLLKRYEEQRKGYRKTSTCLFIAYCLMYMAMTFSQVQIYWSNTLTRSLSSAIELPTFMITNPVSGQISSHNFTTVETRQDVMAFLSQVLPKAMFNSSVGNSQGNENPLKVYHSALPTRLNQLVINNWNIVVGRTQPVRISTRFANMTRVGGSQIGSLVPPDAMKSQSSSQISSAGMSFSPSLIDAQGEGILNPTTRAFLERHCTFSAGYGADSISTNNAYVCMLSRDYQETMSILAEMKRSDFISNQTATVAVDFVIYNGYAEAFLYVAIVFAFQPSGAITKDITTSTIRLDLYNASSVFRAMLEVLVILITCFYIGQSFSNMYKDVQEFRRESRDSRESRSRPCHQRCMSIFRGVTLHLLLDPFNLLDLLSSFLTVVTMVLWYDVVLMKLRNFHFPERPVWDASQTTGWTTDSHVIFDFFQAGQKLQWFIRICAVNTVMIVLRLLKYLQIFPRVQMMFKTLSRGATDVSYFILLGFVILMGYVLMGHQVFGAHIRDFSTIQASLIACFEMFLGTFDSAQLRVTDPFKYVFYTYTYVILFRYMLINMFFAIIDKSFVEEDKIREKLESRRLENAKLQEPKGAALHQPPVSGGVFTRLFVSVKQRFRSSKTSHTAEHAAHADDDSQAAAEDEPGEPHSSGPGEGAIVQHDISNHDRQLAVADDTRELEEVKGDLTEAVVKRVHNWRYLPPEMQSWAIETSSTINCMIDEWQGQRRDCEKKEPHDLDRILVNAESDIKRETQQKWKSALAMKKELQKGELKKLKEIHHEQEALAWYIMKREAELKKLEQAKTRKQERFDEIVQAAKSLISSGDDDGVKALEDRR